MRNAVKTILPLMRNGSWFENAEEEDDWAIESVWVVIPDYSEWTNLGTLDLV